VSVVLLDPHWREIEELFSAGDLEDLKRRHQVIWGQNSPMPAAEIDAAIGQAEVWITSEPRAEKALLDKAQNLKAIIEVSGAFPATIDYDACFKRGIHVLSCAPGFRRAVAEMALGMAIAGGRGLVSEHEGFRRGSEAWLSDCVDRDFTLFGATVGFVGFGAIARETARLLEPAAPTRENQGMIGAEFMGHMQTAALLVVISRAHLVDFAALTEAVSAGRIKAAIDVFPDEPLTQDHPLRHMEGVILSPHRAAAVKGGRQMIGELILADLERIERGDAPQDLGRATPEIVALVAGVSDDDAVSSLIPRTE